MSLGENIYYFSLLVVEFVPATLVTFALAWSLTPKVRLSLLWPLFGFFLTAALSAGVSLLLLVIFGKDTYSPNIDNLAPFAFTRLGVPLLLSVLICIVMKRKFAPKAESSASLCPSAERPR